jgi:DNA-binding protein H-NS
MQFEELWQLYKELTESIKNKVIAEKRALEDRLAKLNRVKLISKVGNNLRPSLSMADNAVPDRALRREYPSKVVPKYCNPLDRSQTWSGRGKKPKWVVAALKEGQGLEDLNIEHVKNDRKQGTRGRQA